jgi:NADH-quinone oxidoreductase subunit C
MADDQKPPEPTEPPTPPLAAADKPASGAPAEPLKGEVSRTDAAGAGASAAPEAKPPEAAAPKPANPTAAQTATTSETSSATGRPTGPADATVRPAAAATPAAAAPKPAPPATAKPAAEHPPKAAAPAGPPDPAPPADQTPPAFIASLQAAVPGAATHISYWVGDWTIIVAAAQILDVARHLRDDSGAAFDLCSDVTASDWPSRAERFDVIYCLYSTRHRRRVRVKARVAEHQPIASVTSVWPAANWLEREVFDMFGVNFTGHPDRRRILMPDDWQGHPQRKDYPLEGPGELLMENPLDWLKLRQARDEADIE